MSAEAKIRKHQTTLICSGLAVIGFGAWSVLRIVISFLLDNSFIYDLIPAVEDIPPEIYNKIVLVTLFCVLAADLSIRLYIGRSAVREGNGKKKRSVYLWLTGLYLASALYADITKVISAVSEGFTLDVAAEVMVDITSCIAFAAIITASLSIRRYARKMLSTEQGGAYAA